MSRPRQEQGITLVEIAMVLTIIGLLLGGILKASELITGARVRGLISQQDNIITAYYGFEERYRAVPGDYVKATSNISGATRNGNGNGRIESATFPNESILAWEHLTQAGFLSPTLVYSATESTLTTLSNSHGVFLQWVKCKQGRISGCKRQTKLLSTQSVPQRYSLSSEPTGP